ncbi:hypothetical protein [Streptomyces cucumeris]|uniref:hypothetical protein n=1 Tax=Streptomyces cucumeris TaxID=2962890 RepID=UPI0020C90081|nr:hypothetical protein [Streptomyces sp. NEAU-Y11]MCP9209290.1 hypothetical protein [Streptomyces sp. NEAU-Y11]
MTWAKRAAEALAGAAGAATARLPGLAGAGLVSAAGWMVYEPLGLAIAGAFCLAMDWRMR